MRPAGLLALSLLLPVAAAADGLHDPYVRLAQVRTDYAAPDEGTAANPLTLVQPCLWPDGTPGLLVPCFTGPDTFAQSNAYRFAGLAPWSPNHWLLLLNNEPWPWPGNSGPPNQSLPRAIPGLGVMGFGVSPALTVGDGLYWRFHLALSHLHDNPAGAFAIPFLSIGAAAGRGNGGLVGTLNDPERPHVVSFRSRLDAVFGSTPDQLWVLSHFLWATADWGGKPRMLFLHLYHDGYVQGEPFEFSTPTVPGATSRWNWPIEESVLFPGAEVAFIDGEDTLTHCGFATPVLTAPGQTIHAEVDLQALYRCLSDHGLYDEPMPHDVPVPLTGVHWGNELTGERVALATTVWGIDIRAAGEADKAGVDLDAVRPGAETTRMVEALQQACRADLRCASRNAPPPSGVTAGDPAGGPGTAAGLHTRQDPGPALRRKPPPSPQD